MLSWFYSSSNYNSFPLAKRSVKKYGWKPDFPDQRDLYAFFPYNTSVKEHVDLRKSGYIPEVYNQGELGSCTANAIGAAFAYDQKKQGLENFDPSRLFLYYNEREIEGTVDQDSGASIRDGIKVISRIGICPEADHPYNVANFATKPTDIAYTDALLHTSVEYRRVNVNILDIKKVLSSGYPVVIGFSVYESFTSEEVAKTGIMPMPDLKEKIVGGHAVMIIGYDNKKKVLFVRNSWGSSWGQEGYFEMPVGFVSKNHCADAWVIQSVKDGELDYPFKQPNF